MNSGRQPAAAALKNLDLPFRPFDANDIKLIRLANRDTLDSRVRNIVDALASCLEENLPLPVRKLQTYKRDIVEILIDAAGDGNTILAEELYNCVLGLRQPPSFD